MKAHLFQLSELGEIVSGSTPKTGVTEFWNGDIPWVTPADLTSHDGIWFQGKPKGITQAGYDSCSTRMLPRGSILFSSRAPIGHCAVAPYPLCTNQGFKSLVTNDRLDPIYGYFALRFVTPSIIARGRGATFAEVSTEIMESIQIPVPSLPQQQQIARQLEEADRLRRTRRYALALSDTFLPAAFLQLFGDSSYRNVRLEELAADEKNSVVNGPFGSDLLTRELTRSGVPVIYIRDISSGRYERTSTSFVTTAKAAELEFCNAKPGDVLVAKVGDPPGIAVIYPTTEMDGVVTQDVIRIRPNTKLVSPAFLQAFLNSSLAHREMAKIMVQGTRQRFSLGQFKEISVPLPALNLQNEFALLMTRAERLRSVQRESLRQAEHLFQTLLHRAFGGVSDRAVLR